MRAGRACFRLARNSGSPPGLAPIGGLCRRSFLRRVTLLGSIPMSYWEPLAVKL